MLLGSVILVLQETLEAALLVSVLMMISYQLWNRVAWLLIGIGGGLVLSYLYSSNMVEVSEWFDYVGQEIVNAGLQVLTAFFIVVCTWAAYKSQRRGSVARQTQTSPFASLFVFCAAAAVALAITREGSEILLYLGGFLQQQEYFRTIMVGSSIGFSIGLSIGILLYYGLSNLPVKWRLDAAVILMALFAGNMLAQSVLQLTQADWIPSSRSFWDTSHWLPEGSILGQLLYALVGYEATPSAAQLVAYTTGVLLVLAFRAAGKHPKR